MSEPMPFGRVVRRARLAAGLTQEALAERAGISPRGVGDIERGVSRAPQQETVALLAEALGLAGAERVAFEAAARRLAARTPVEPAVHPGAEAPPTAPAPDAVPQPAPSVAPLAPRLPAPATSFVGRDQELAEVRRRLGETRLLTLIGAGGVGKTRLALEVARSVQAGYCDGVWLVELAALADGALVADTVARALGVVEQPGRTPTQALAAWLADRQLLLVLDNCEHLIEGCAQVVEALLAGCPGLQVLATSREALRLGGEVAWRVPSLALPGGAGRATPAQVLGSEAGRLFATRADFVRPGFVVTVGNAGAVAEVCRRLDGIPLALELAAARVRVMTVEQIAARLDDAAGLLTGGSRGAPTRQQTLRAVIDWSHALLTEAERMIFRRLAVFAGGWTLEAAEAVGAGDGVEASEVLDLLTALVDKSLVQAEEAGGEERYRLLEPVRQYALERLRAAAEEQTVWAGHAAWYLVLAERAAPALETGDQLIWLARLDAEDDNLRAALAWSLEHDPPTNWRLAVGLTRYWLLRGRCVEGRDWLERQLTREPATAARRARALWCAGLLAHGQDDYAAARRYFDAGLGPSRASGDAAFTGRLLVVLADMSNHLGDSRQRAVWLVEEALALIRPAGDLFGLTMAVDVQGTLAFNLGDITRGQAWHDERLVLARQLGERVTLSMALWYDGTTAMQRGAFAEARALFDEGLRAADEIRAPRPMANLRQELGMAAYAEGDLGEARARFEEVLALVRGLDYPVRVAWAEAYLGRVARREGDIPAATTLLETSLRRSRAVGHVLGMASTLQGLGELAWTVGDVVTARRRFGETLVIYRDMPEVLSMPGCLERLATTAAGDGRAARAARLLGQAAGLRTASGRPRWPIDEPDHQASLATARETLGEAAFAAAWSAGQTLTLDEAIAEALAEAESEPTDGN